MRATGWAVIVVALAATAVRGGQGGDDVAGRVIPADEVLVYAEWAGLETHPEAWKRTAAARLLSETKLGAGLGKLLRQSLAVALAETRDGDAPPAEQVEAMVRGVIDHGALFAVSGRPDRDPNPRMTIVLRRPSDALRELLEASLARGGEPERVERAGRRMARVAGGRQPVYWWTEGNDLVVHLAASDDDMAFVERLGGGALGVAHERRQALLRREGDFQPMLAAWLDTALLRGQMPPEARRLGLDTLGLVDLRWGFEGEALRTIVRVQAPAPRRGLLALLDQPAFDVRAALNVVPRDSTGFTVMSLDAARLHDRILEIARGEARDPREIDQVATRLDERLGVKLRDEVLARLGPLMAVRVGEWQVLPMPAGAGGPPVSAALPKVTLVGEVRDPAALRAALGRMMPRLSAELGTGRPEDPRIEAVEGGYTMSLPGLPPGFDLAPTLLVGERVVVLATTADDGRAALTELDAGRGGWTAEGPFAGALASLPERAVMMGVSDPRETMPEVIAGLPQTLDFLGGAVGAARDAAARNAGRPAGPPMPRLAPGDVPTADQVRPYLFPSAWALSVDDKGLRYDSRESVPGLSTPAASGVAVALLLPAVQAAREAARRAQCSNNERHILLAMHNYAVANQDRFPPAAIRSADGAPLLSWRVAVLPYLEQQALYEKFHLDEPWDSPHNKALLKEMPAVYGCPSKTLAPGMTSYRVVTSPGAPFGVEAGPALREITDGTSNTIGVVEATEEAPWTKPEEFPLADDPRALTKQFGSAHPGGFNAAFLDGSVRFLVDGIEPAVLKALSTRAGGEVIRPESLAPRRADSGVESLDVVVAVREDRRVAHAFIPGESDDRVAGGRPQRGHVGMGVGGRGGSARSMRRAGAGRGPFACARGSGHGWGPPISRAKRWVVRRGFGWGRRLASRGAREAARAGLPELA